MTDKFTDEFIREQREITIPNANAAFSRAVDEIKINYPDALTEIERLRGAQNAECHWHQEDDDWGLWIGECGAAWEFTDGGPVENDVHFCPNCGKKLVIVEKGGEK